MMKCIVKIPTTNMIIKQDLSVLVTKTIFVAFFCMSNTIFGQLLMYPPLLPIFFRPFFKQLLDRDRVLQVCCSIIEASVCLFFESKSVEKTK